MGMIIEIVIMADTGFGIWSQGCKITLDRNRF